MKKNFLSKIKDIVFVFLICVSTSISSNENSKYDLKFVYINSNTGQSAGGHFALIIGALVYHFVFYPNKLFHIQRESYKNFMDKYTTIQNRTATVHKISLSKKNYEKILNHFNLNYLIIEKHKYNLQQIQTNIQILKSLIEQKPFQVEGAGYFTLKEISEHRSNLILLEKKPFRSSIQNLLSPKNINLKLLNSKHFFIIDHSVFIDFNRKIELLFLKDILNGRMQLNPENSFCTEIRIEKQTLNFFKQFKKRKEKELGQKLNQNLLFRSYIIDLARLLIVEKSIREKKLCALNIIRENSEYVTKEKLNTKEAKNRLEVTKKEIYRLQKNLDKEKNINSISVLEKMLNHYYMMKEKKVLFIHLQEKSFYPSKTGLVHYKLPISEQKKKRLTQNYQQLEKTYLTYSKTIRNMYKFNLFYRNCSTEIFHNLNQIYSKAEIKKIFGGNIQSPLLFIPLMASRNIKKKYLKQQTSIVLSYRKKHLKELYKQKSKISTYLKESNTLSSSVYKLNRQDGFFLFFTDDQIWTRPIFGIFNFSAGLLYSVYGLVKVPFDRGTSLKKGIQTSFYSLPELFFFNIRKGTFPYLKIQN